MVLSDAGRISAVYHSLAADLQERVRPGACRTAQGFPVLRHIHPDQYGVESVVLKRTGLHGLTPFRLALNGVLTLGLNLALALLHEFFSARLLWPAPSEEGFLYSVYIFSIVASIVSQFHIIRYYAKLALRQQSENLALTKAKLKSQLNPHFVFNSLNILAGLIEENPGEAERFTVSLSKIYRYIVNSLEKDVVPITEAMTVAKEYVSILQTRFPSSIDFRDGVLECRSEEKILTMSLQLLIENAVKHNCPSPERPLRISVFKRGDRLVVSNNLCDSDRCDMLGVRHDGIGLNNLTKRYLMECSKAPEISVAGGGDSRCFEVSLPIIRQL